MADYEQFRDFQDGARVTLNLDGIDPANWSAEEHRRVMSVLSAVAYGKHLPDDTRRLVIAARMVAWEDPDPANLKELQDASEAFAGRIAWEDEPND